MELRFFEIYRSSEFAILLLQGIKTSIALTVIAGIFGFVFAITLAASRYFKIPLLRYYSVGFVEFTRNTPLIVQLFSLPLGYLYSLVTSGPFGPMHFWR